MALVVADRVQETTTTTGTGTITLAGAVSGFQTFAVIGNANTTYYTVTSGTAWEVGLGTYTSSGTTLSRDTVLASSAGGTTKITLAGTSNVFCVYPASKAVFSPAISVINTNTNAVVNTYYVFTASLTLTLPASPTVGDKISISDLSNSLTCVIGRNGGKIQALSEDLTLDYLNASFNLIYVDATRGWVIL